MTKIFYRSIRGITYVNSDGTSRQELAKSVRKGQKVTLKADPSNEFDRWAVEVIVNGGAQIGFLPSDARDASAILKGEPISAKVHRVTGATNWFSRVILGKKSIGVVLAISKGEPDWGRYSQLTEIAKPIDDLVEKALSTEKSGDIEKAIKLYKSAIEEIVELTVKDKFASAHRRHPAPINRLSLLLEKSKDYAGALEVIQKHYKNFDPVQPDKADRKSIKKRYERLGKKLGTK